MGRNADGARGNDVLNMNKLIFTTLIFSLALVGCAKKNQNENIQDTSKSSNQAKTVVTAEGYQKAIYDTLQPYWSTQQITGVKNNVLEITAPSEFINLHFNIVIAFELMEQGQAESDQAKIEEGIENLNDLASQNSWLR